MKTGPNKSKVASIENVQGDGEKWRGVYYHHLVMENGDKIDIGKKKLLDIGDELDYEVLEIDQHEYSKAKAYNPEWTGDQSSTTQRQATQTPKNNGRGQNASFALSYAKDQQIANGMPVDIEPNTDNIANFTISLADKYLAWLNGDNN